MTLIDRLILTLDYLGHLGDIAGGNTVNADGGATFVVMLIIMVISTALQLLLAPKPPRPKPASLEDFSVPTAQQDRPVPLIDGTVTITGPNVVWYGDLYAEPIPAPKQKK